MNGRSYEVATPDGKTFRRNRQLLREATKPRQEKPANQEATETKDVDNTAPYTESKTNGERNEGGSTEDKPNRPRPTIPAGSPVSSKANPYITRSGRVVKPPERLQL